MNLNEFKGRGSSRSSSKGCPSMTTSKQPSSNLTSIISMSPLKVPLNHAVSKLLTTINKAPANSRIKASRKSSLSTPSHSFPDQSDSHILQTIHPEVFEFLQKYFGGRNTSQIPTDEFTEGLIEEYIGPINDETILTLFSAELKRSIGEQYMILWKLDQCTKGKGLSGFIMDICTRIKENKTRQDLEISNLYFEEDSSIASPELNNLKNVLTEFFEAMAKSIENQIYAKFNKEMRKLVVKYNETEELLREVNERITYNFDKIKGGERRRKERGVLEQRVEEERERIRVLVEENKKQEIKYSLVFAENIKLVEDNKTLLIKIYKLQEELKEAVSKKASQKQYVISTTSTDRNQQFYQQPTVSNFITSIIPPVPKIIPLSPIKRTSSTASNRIHSHPHQQIGINLTTKLSTPKTQTQTRRNSKPSMIYFA